MAAERHDALLVHAADFIRSDERTHVRKGRHIIRVMTLTWVRAGIDSTRELFTECLVSLGVVQLDMDVFTVRARKTRNTWLASDRGRTGESDRSLLKKGTFLRATAGLFR